MAIIIVDINDGSHWKCCPNEVFLDLECFYIHDYAFLNKHLCSYSIAIVTASVLILWLLHVCKCRCYWFLGGAISRHPGCKYWILDIPSNGYTKNGCPVSSDCGYLQYINMT